MREDTIRNLDYLKYQMILTLANDAAPDGPLPKLVTLLHECGMPADGISVFLPKLADLFPKQPDVPDPDFRAMFGGDMGIVFFNPSNNKKGDDLT